MPLASEYRAISANFQRKDGEGLINLIQPCVGDIVLDMGCGTGDVTALMAERVGPTGKVIGVDPDVDRIKLARETHQHHKNVTFEVGSSFCFPGDGEENYDIVFCSNSLQWIANKTDFFRKAFSCLKKNGKLASYHELRTGNLLGKIVKRFALEHLLTNLYQHLHVEKSEVIKSYITSAGLEVVYNGIENGQRYMFDSILDFLEFVSTSSYTVPNFRQAVIQFGNEEIKVFEDELKEYGKIIEVYDNQIVIARK